jgi:hypothetical protein
MDSYYNNLNNKNQVNKSSRFEHIAGALIKILILVFISVMFFSYDNFAFGFLFATLGYVYTFYGLFIKQPAESKPYHYVGGSAWNASKVANFERNKPKSRTTKRQANYSSTNPTDSSTQMQNSDEDSFISSEIINDSISENMQFNPATGLQVNFGIDSMGNPNGFDNHDLMAGSSFNNLKFSDDSFASDDHLDLFSDEF